MISTWKELSYYFKRAQKSFSLSIKLMTLTRRSNLIAESTTNRQWVPTLCSPSPKFLLDSLPYTRMIPLIASKLPGAPQKPRLKLDLDQTTFKACFGKYSEDIKKTFITMIDSTRTGP